MDNKSGDYYDLAIKVAQCTMADLRHNWDKSKFVVRDLWFSHASYVTKDENGMFCYIDKYGHKKQLSEDYWRLDIYKIDATARKLDGREAIRARFDIETLERLEKERLEKERLEKERLEKERLEKERLEKERLEQQIREGLKQKILELEHENPEWEKEINERDKREAKEYPARELKKKILNFKNLRTKANSLRMKDLILKIADEKETIRTSYFGENLQDEKAYDPLMNAKLIESLRVKSNTKSIKKTNMKKNKKVLIKNKKKIKKALMLAVSPQNITYQIRSGDFKELKKFIGVTGPDWRWHPDPRGKYINWIYEKMFDRDPDLKSMDSAKSFIICTQNERNTPTSENGTMFEKNTVGPRFGSGSQKRVGSSPGVVGNIEDGCEEAASSMKIPVQPEEKKDTKNRNNKYTGKKVVVDENTEDNKEAKLIDERIRNSNDVESNPGPPMENVKMMKTFLNWEPPRQERCIHKLFQNIRELHGNDLNRNIPTELYTEENLIILIDIFDLSVRNKYQSDIMEKIAALKSHWYKTVRMQEKKQRRAKKRLSTPRGCKCSHGRGGGDGGAVCAKVES